MNSIHDERQQQQHQIHNGKITTGEKKKKGKKGTKITPGRDIIKDIKDQKDSSFIEKKKEHSFFSEKKKVPKNNVINKCNGNVVTTIQNNSNLEAISAAFSTQDNLPSRLQSALGGASIELDNNGNIKILRQDTVDNYSAVKMMLRKNAMQGWLEWLQGRRGWTLATDKSPYLEYHRDLHEAYSISLRTLMKNHNDLRSYLVVLYYKQEPLTHENACDGDKTPK